MKTIVVNHLLKDINNINQELPTEFKSKNLTEDNKNWRPLATIPGISEPSLT
jgi:hypothetical protein